jgi:hypothetical protein
MPLSEMKYRIDPMSYPPKKNQGRRHNECLPCLPLEKCCRFVSKVSHVNIINIINVPSLLGALYIASN